MVTKVKTPPVGMKWQCAVQKLHIIPPVDKAMIVQRVETMINC